MIDTDLAPSRARLVCRIVIVDDHLGQAQLIALAMKAALEINIDHKNARSEPIETSYCIALLAPKKDESGDEFWKRCVGSFSGRIEDVNQTLWTRNAAPSE